MDKMREEFEAWCIGLNLPIGRLWSDSSSYETSFTQGQWSAWQASRAAMCIELPKTPDFSASDEPDLAFEWGVDVMKDLIESAGVTCK